MFCILYSLAKGVNAIIFAIANLFALAAGALVIAFGIFIQDELSIISFSKFLHKKIELLVYQVSIPVGAVVIVNSLFGFVFISPLARKWMYYIYQPIGLFAFAVLMGMGFYLNKCGMVATQVIQDYCNNSFERWTLFDYGQYAVALDNTYAEMSKTYMCSSTCPCDSVNYNLWASSTMLKDNYSAQLEYKKKNFTGSNINVFGCMDEDKMEELGYDIDVINYLTDLETNNDCAGICQQQYFFPFTNVALGPPSESCKNYIIEDFSGSKGIIHKYSTIFFVSGMLVFFAFFMALGLCFRAGPMWQNKKVGASQDTQQ